MFAGPALVNPYLKPFLNLHVNLHVNEKVHMKLHVNLHMNNKFHVKVHAKLQMNIFLHMKVHMKVHVKAHLKDLSNGAGCSDGLAAAHYRLAHAVPVVGLRPITEPNHISYLDYNRLIERSGWSHALGVKTESDKFLF